MSWRRLLVCDTPGLVRSTLEFCLREAGFEFFTRPSGRRAQISMTVLNCSVSFIQVRFL